MVNLLKNCLVLQKKYNAPKKTYNNKFLKTIYSFFLLSFMYSSSLHATAGWLPVNDVYTLSGISTSSNTGKPQIVSFSNGTAIAIWMFQGAMSNVKIQSAKYDGENWAQINNLEDTAEYPNGFTVPSPASLKLVAGPNNTAFGIWEIQSGTRQILSSKFDGTQWVPTHTADGPTNFSISDSSVSSAEPQITALPNGNALAVWSVSTDKKIYSNMFNGNTWGGTANIMEVGASLLSVYQPRLASFPDGTAVAIWNDNVMVSQYKIAGSKFNGSSWVATNDPSGVYTSTFDPQIATFSDGTALAIWSVQTAPSMYQVVGAKYNGTQWVATNALSTISPDAFESQITLLPGGEALAVWTFSSDLTNYNIQGAKYNGSNWVSTNDLSNSNANDSPQVASYPDGTAISVWSEVTGVGTTKIASATYNGTSWDPTTDLSVTNKACLVPQIASFSTGGALAVWTYRDGTNYSIQGSKYVGEPKVISISPNVGEIGTNVTITGMNLLPNPIVKFANNNAAIVGPTTAGSIVATAPSGVGSVHVTVTTDNGISPETSADLYLYAQLLSAAPVSGGKKNTGMANLSAPLSWAEPENFTAVIYRIYRNGKLVQELPSSTFAFEDNYLHQKTKYNYEVYAVDVQGASVLVATMQLETQKIK